jgi:type II secretory pathway pseudopilin PulG
MIESRRGASADEGFAMAALLVAMTVMAIAMTVALPVWHTAAQREKEAELIFRGQQYARALALFQRRFPGAIPPNVDVLIDGRMLRKRYKDPITNDDFQIIGPGDGVALQGPEGAATPGVRTPGSPPQPGAAGPNPRQSSTFTAPTFSINSPSAGGARGSFSGAGGSTFSLSNAGGASATVGGPGAASGGVVGVVSKSKDTSLRLYNGRNHYNEWVFMATQQTLRAGGPGGAAGGRGANQPVSPGRGFSPTPGRGGLPQGPAGPGRFGAPGTGFPPPTPGR